MNNLKTSLIISAFLSTSSFAWAMPPGGPMCDEAGYRNEARNSRMAKQHSERLKRLHDTLKLQPEQEAHWQKFQAALEVPADRGGRPVTQATDTPSRMEQMKEQHQQSGKVLDAHLEAVKTFYATLTPEQKKIFDEHHAPARERRNPR